MGSILNNFLLKTIAGKALVVLASPWCRLIDFMMKETKLNQEYYSELWVESCFDQFLFSGVLGIYSLHS